MANHPINRKIIVFDAAIQQPAKRHFDARRALNDFNVRARIAQDDADDDAREAYFRLQYAARIQWLQDEYNGEEQQRLARGQLFRNQQKPNESPREFYHRIEEQMEKSGLPVAQNDVALEQIFLQGLREDISLHVRILPLNTLDRMLKAAENYWAIFNDQGNVSRVPSVVPRVAPKRILTNPRFYEEEPPAPTPRATYQEPQWYQDAPQEPQHDPVMDELVQQMAQLRAHVVKLEAQKNKPAQRNYDYRNQLDDQDRQNFRYQRRPERSTNQRFRREDSQDYPRRSGECYKCGEAGHFAKECTNEMGRPAVPATERTDRRRQEETRRVNTVSQFYIRDSDSGSQSDQEDVQWDFRRENPRPRVSRKTRPHYRPGTITDDERESSTERSTAFAFPVTVKKDKSSSTKPYERKVRQSKSFPDFETKPKDVVTPEFMEA